MGLIKAAINAVSGTLKDQYKEVISCDSLPMDVLVKKGQKMSAAGSTNRGNDNIISDGSVVMVADGQCVLIVENGKILDFSMETGDYIWNTGGTPSMLTGGFSKILDSFKTVGSRIQTGGGQDKNQRVYYVNTKEIMDNKFGAGDIPFRDSEFNVTMKLKCFGTYTYKIEDPIIFFKNVSGNVTNEYRRSEIDAQLKSEIQDALGPALNRIGAKRISYDQLISFKKEAREELNAELKEEWLNKRGISVEKFALASVVADDASLAKINEYQDSRVYTNVEMLGARIGTAQAESMVNASKNSGGSMQAFMGMGMAQQAGGMNAAQLFQMGQQNQPQQPMYQQPQPVTPQPAQANESHETKKEGWTCECGAVNEGKFCCACGAKAPVPVEKPKTTWTCECGKENEGKFCGECGKTKPVVLDAKCETCGYEGSEPFKFCPECGALNKE